jgi:hypothetical protein
MFIAFNLLVFLLLLPLMDATISANFEKYIKQKYGAAVAKQIARTDFGSGGSFGGGQHQAGKKTR